MSNAALLAVLLLTLGAVRGGETLTRPDAAQFYVAVDGDDAGPGTQEKPFATLAHARDAVRELKTRFAGPITVLVRGGTYYLSEPLVFTPSDSGTAQSPVTYAAYPGETPVLSGGRKIAAIWKPFRDGILMCSLPEAKAGRLAFTQLFINGKRQTLARFPNGSSVSPDHKGYLNPTGADSWPHKAFTFDPATFTQKRWARPEEAVVHIFAQNYWGNMQWRVRSVDWDSHTIHLGEGGRQLNELYQRSGATGIGTDSRYFIENVFEELDAPGEWYLDRRAGVLYFMPPAGVNMADAPAEAPVLKEVVAFRGSRRDPVKHITLNGFRIAHTATTFLEPYEAPSLGDWSIYRGGAVFFEGAEDCAITHSFFDAVGGNGVFISDYNRRIRISDNTFTEAGDSAVCLVGKSRVNPNGSYTCKFCGQKHGWSFDKPTGEYPSACLIANNVIHDIGVFGKQTAGVFLSLTFKNRVSHNLIYNTPRAAICINDGTWGGHLIEYNDIHDTVRETGDHGPFNSWGRDSSWCEAQSHGGASHPAGDVKKDAKYTTIIRNNRFRDVHGWGIDLDDGSSNYLIYQNLCIGIGIKLREGAYRTVENNIIVNPAIPFNTHVCYEDNHDRIVRNIIVVNSKFDTPETDVNFKPGKHEGSVYQGVYMPNNSPWAAEIDANTFFSDIGHFSADFTKRNGERKRYTLEEWRKLGYDRHSIYADPLFVNPAQEDFRVRPDSPALQRGFKNFPMNQFGPIPDNRRQNR